MILEVSNKFPLKRSSTASMSGSSAVDTPVAHISLTLSFTSLSLSFFSSGAPRSEQTETESLKTRWTRGVLRSGGKASRREREGGRRNKREQN